MKIFAMVFDYNLKTMSSSGRHWATEAYKNKEYIFDYSAASFASFLYHNPHLPFVVYTDDVNLLAEKLSKYSVDTRNLSLIDLGDQIHEWNKHPYAFWPLTKIFEYNAKNNDDNVILKLDNDLTCKKSIDDMLLHKGAYVWKFERLVAKGRPYWGEIHVARHALGTDQFKIFNMGVWGLSRDFLQNHQELSEYTQALSDVDISNVCHFPDNPGFKAKIYACSEQVANNFYIHKHSIPVLETHPWFDHHCYVKSKQSVLDSVAHLVA